MRFGIIAALLVSLTGGTALAASPPPTTISYQGVLRDSANQPLNGLFSITFRLYDDTGSSADEIYYEVRSGSNAVAVVNGTFTVDLGRAGLGFDGTGPGVFTNLRDVFANYSAVYLQLEVEGEALSPRIRVHAAPYALNAATLDGMPAASFLDTSIFPNRKQGSLELAGGLWDLVNTLGDFSIGTGPFRFKIGIALTGDGTGDTYLGTFGGTNRLFLGGGASPQSLTITPGRVGIGTDAPQYPLDVRASALGSTASFTSFTHLPGVIAPARARLAQLELNGELTESTGVFAEGYTGVFGVGQYEGAQFSGPGPSFVTLASNDYGASAPYGIRAQAPDFAGEFIDSNERGRAVLGWGSRGIWSFGTFAGGTFSLLDGSGFEIGYADVARVSQSGTPFKILGTGTVSFVQNHPQRPDHVIVYAAPEGGEVAVYTRGSARLEGGVARIPLEDSFALVANPDVGLTAHVTPRGGSKGLYVESVTTDELVVREVDGGTSEVLFDYLVYGLRVGFERHMVIQPKTAEAPLPQQGLFDAFAAERPDLVATTALARYGTMEQALTGRAVDTSRSRQLMSAIDAARDPGLVAVDPSVPARRGVESASTIPIAGAIVPRSPSAALGKPRTGVPAERATEELAPSRVATLPSSSTFLPVSGNVVPGDVLVLDATVPGSLRASEMALDRGVAGCALAPPDDVEVPQGQALVATSGVALCRVDAGDTGIAIGDVLVTAATLAHATRGTADAPGIVLGKAMEPLTAGTGMIRVLVTLR